MDNAYTFDAVSNVLSVANNASFPANGNAGGQMSHSYTYDGLYRIATAKGPYTGADNKFASYTLAMGYDNMHRIKSKSQHLTQGKVQFNGTEIKFILILSSFYLNGIRESVNLDSSYPLFFSFINEKNILLVYQFTNASYL